MIIFIFEDDFSTITEVKSIVDDCLKKLNITDVEIKTGQKEHTFSKHLETPSLGNLYILDIETNSNKYTGFELATTIHRLDPDGVIIFYSSRDESIFYALKHKVNAHDFISKFESEEVVRSRFLKAIKYAYTTHQQVKRGDAITFESNGEIVEFYLDDILYIEIKDGYSTFHTLNSKPLTFYISLSKLEELAPQLLRIHRSTLINPQNVVGYDRKSEIAVFCDDSAYPVSKKHASKLTELMLDSNDEDDEVITLTF